MKRHNALMRTPLAALAALLTMVAMPPVLSSCREEAKPGVTSNVDPEHTPTMLTRDVETLISDSGVTRFRIATPLWLMYDEAKRPFWRFPKGLRVTRYDDLMRTAATVDCDSATYLKDPQIWQLDGHVRITTANKDRFLTNQLFWDQRRHKLYSDSFIRIEKPDRVLEGFGFTANERLTSYEIRRVSGIFPAKALSNH